MISAQIEPTVEAPPPETASGSATKSASGSAVRPTEATALREAMLIAIGELSEEERSRLSSSEQPEDLARAWRDLIAERAAREREMTVRAELTREFEQRTRAAQPQPTRGLRGGAPSPAPGTVAEWAEYIRSTTEHGAMQRRRAQFADWLAVHPEA